MIHLQVDPEFEANTPTAALIKAAQATLDECCTRKEEPALTVIITNNEQLHQFNMEYLDIDAPTDVLSFPDGEFDPETGEFYLGDILISAPIAAYQAEQGGHSIDLELQLLVVHGTLHLLGHDHSNEEEKAAMWLEQEKILRMIDNPLSTP